ncbi:MULTISPECIES: hypothetical protein [Microbacterium]|uniref:hypothetical protein n=1 Tax=Microbacterium TaxID=33882 RepID=UPI00217D703F|nr:MULTISPECIES: hypothetical protein [Microbacterium]UWF77901.1 hypothetical protein JSY13_02225 [Microbacterium neungamense]WCM56078.1 hypothetical protein JRG78_02270 [Microbacterium sp. EF45047]
MRRYRIARDVGVLDAGERVYVAGLPEGPVVILDGPAVTAWRAAVGSQPADAAAVVADAAEIQRYTAALAEAGFIVEEDARA